MRATTVTARPQADRTARMTMGITLVIPMVILAVLSACGLAVTVVARKRASR